MKDVLQALRGQRGWLVRAKGTNLELIRNFNGRPVTLFLNPAGHGKYHLRFPSYIFQSTISHFAPTEDERRFCRNKDLLGAVIKVLKRSELWKHIENQNFMIVNPANSRSDKTKLRTELESLRAYTPRELIREQAKKASR